MFLYVIYEVTQYVNTKFHYTNFFFLPYKKPQKYVAYSLGCLQLPV